MSTYVGRRVYCEGYIGTVLFCGDVPPAPGVWLGVDWDDPKRGRHDGTANGVRYFVTRFPTSGSFVRPSKVELGVSCLEAICHQYQGSIKEDSDNLYILQKDNVAFPVTVIGCDKIMSKQNQLNKLHVVCIERSRVSHEGLHDELLLAVPNIVELDLSFNLFHSWSQIANICVQLRQLTVLTVSGNRLSIPDEPSSLRLSCQRLQVVVMNKMNYDWDQVVSCTKMFPSLLQLHVAFNVIQQLKVPAGETLHNLESLDLEGNCIASWSEVNKLCGLASLKYLSVISTSLDGIKLESGGMFSSLNNLLLQNNLISCWDDINELNKLPCLEELSIHQNPILDTDKPETIRQFIIARISRLKKLNRITITRSERRGAELDYLKKYGREWLETTELASESAWRAFRERHPRYEHLVNVYGKPEAGEMTTQPVILKNSLISLEFDSPLLDKSVVKKLPATLSVQKLRTLVQRMVRKESPVLFCESLKTLGHKVEMSKDFRQLSYYVEDGDRIYIE